MNASGQRIKQMLLGWGTVGVIYSLSDHLQGVGYRLRPSVIDNLIPFTPDAVWLYLSFFLIIPLGFLLVPFSHLRWLARAMQCSALGAGAVYLLWPTTMAYPSFSAGGIATVLLNGLIHVDSSQNCFPSLHAALTLLAVRAISLRRNAGLTVLSVIWALAIAFSILQLRRHLFIDLVGGGVLAWLCGWLATGLGRYTEKLRESHE